MSQNGRPTNREESAKPCKQTLAQFLEKGISDLMVARRVKGGEAGAGDDFIVCTSHDLAPLLLEACALPKQHFETRVFKDSYKRWEKDARKAEKKKGRMSGDC